MKTTGGDEKVKQKAGEAAAKLAENEMTVGLGTGSTAAHAVRALGKRVNEGLDIQAIPTSYQSADLVREAGIPVVTLDDATPDLAIDGADQIAGFDLIKGGGAAHTKEKLVDSAAERFVVVADSSKEIELFNHPVPLEILPSARTPVSAAVQDLGGEPKLRSAECKDGPVVTDNGNLLLDCKFGRIENPGELAGELSGIPGVVDHGLFVGLADEIFVGTDEGVEERRR